MFHLALLPLLLIVPSVDMCVLPTTTTQRGEVRDRPENAPPFNEVAFTASVRNEATVRIGARVIYDNVKYNKGQAYSGTTGFFTAPVSGTYVFFFKMEAKWHNTAALKMFKERSLLLYIYGSGMDNNPTASATVVTYMAANERVWVESARDTTLVRYLYDFGGFLLYQDP